MSGTNNRAPENRGEQHGTGNSGPTTPGDDERHRARAHPPPAVAAPNPLSRGQPPRPSQPPFPAEPADSDPGNSRGAGWARPAAPFSAPSGPRAPAEDRPTTGFDGSHGGDGQWQYGSGFQSPQAPPYLGGATAAWPSRPPVPMAPGRDPAGMYLGALANAPSWMSGTAPYAQSQTPQGSYDPYGVAHGPPAAGDAHAQWVQQSNASYQYRPFVPQFVGSYFAGPHGVYYPGFVVNPPVSPAYVYGSQPSYAASAYSGYDSSLAGALAGYALTGLYSGEFGHRGHYAPGYFGQLPQLNGVSGQPSGVYYNCPQMAADAGLPVYDDYGELSASMFNMTMGPDPAADDSTYAFDAAYQDDDQYGQNLDYCLEPVRHINYFQDGATAAHTEQVRALARFYYSQITHGCSGPCKNSYCARNPAFIKREPLEAALLAATLSQYGKSYACHRIKPGYHVDESVLKAGAKWLANYQTDTWEYHLQMAKAQAAFEARWYKEGTEAAELRDITRLDKRSFLEAFKILQAKGKLYLLSSTLSRFFDNLECMSQAFPAAGAGNYPLDSASVRFFYEEMYNHCPSVVPTEVLESATAVFDRICRGIDVVRDEHLTIFALNLMNPQITSYAARGLLTSICYAMALLPPDRKSKWCRDFALPRTAPPGLQPKSAAEDQQREMLADDLKCLLSVVQQYINLRVRTRWNGYTPHVPPHADSAVVSALDVLRMLYRVNESHPGRLLGHEAFYNNALSDSIDLSLDLSGFMTGEGLSFGKYSFALNMLAKSDLIKQESVISMRSEFQGAFFRALFIGVNFPYLHLDIRRDFLIRDTLFQLEGKPRYEYRKQLKVSFLGEEGVDEGGVQKEFFQLAVRELFDEKYGMFVVKEGSRVCWFMPEPLPDDLVLEEYRLVGRLIGLAIYNGVILDVHFPMALYKKLKGVPVTIDDLREVDPGLVSGLETLLNFCGNVEEAYMRTFKIDYESLKHHYTEELKPGGGEITLTGANRIEFVQLYVDFLLNKSTNKQFMAFQEGFYMVCDGPAIQMFRPEELELLICGENDLDFRALETSAFYDGGFSPTHRVIRWFWEIVHEFSQKEKKALLFFTTGSDRVPIGGLKMLRYTISKNGVDSIRLPTAHTCFNTLMLCDYSSKEKLKEKLQCALQNAEGFGLI